MPRPSQLLIAILIVSTLQGCGKTQREKSPLDGSQAPDAAQQPSADSHQQMLELLGKIKRRIPLENAFLDDAELNRLYDELARLPERSTVDRAVLNFNVGAQNVFRGNTRQGIEEQEFAYKMLSRARGQIPASALDGLVFQIGVAYLRLGETENCVEAQCVATAKVRSGASWWTKSDPPS